jgi:hypothetical protein
MADLPAFAKDWLRQRERGAAAVARVEEQELRDLDDAEALRQADALLSAAPLGLMTADRKTTSGFVEQQRLFARARR